MASRLEAPTLRIAAQEAVCLLFREAFLTSMLGLVGNIDSIMIDLVICPVLGHIQSPTNNRTHDEDGRETSPNRFPYCGMGVGAVGEARVLGDSDGGGYALRR